jgi:hypothetical protein
MRGMQGGYAEVRISQDGGVSMAKAEAAGRVSGGGGSGKQMRLKQPPSPPSSWVVPQSDFTNSELVGETMPLQHSPQYHMHSQCNHTHTHRVSS